MRLAISTTETSTDLMTDLVVANNNNNKGVGRQQQQPYGILGCSGFLICVCMFIVSKLLLISSATVIVRAGGAILLNPYATVLFNVCSSVTVECCVM